MGAPLSSALRSGALDAPTAMDTGAEPDAESFGVRPRCFLRLARRLTFGPIPGSRGGIDAERLPSVLETGASRIVVVRAVTDATDPEAAARELRKFL